MEYQQHHISEWFKKRPCLSLECIEKNCLMPKGTLRHFLKERRKLPERSVDVLVKEISKYGYVQSDTE